MALGTTGGMNQFAAVNASTAGGFQTTMITQPGVAQGAQVCFVSVGNTNASPRFLKFYDTINTPQSGTQAVGQMIIPGNSAGAGSNIGPGTTAPLFAGLQFTTGIAIGFSNNIALTDMSGISGPDVTVWIGWR